MSTTTTAALRRFSEGYARTLHFFVSIADRSLYDQLEELFQRRPYLWPNKQWLFDVQDVFVAYYEDASIMNSLWEEWTRDYDRRLALLEGLPFAEQELALQKLSTLCMRTPQSIDDILRLKARAHYAIKIITRTLLPTLTDGVCQLILRQRKGLPNHRVQVKPVPLPSIAHGALLQHGRNNVLHRFPDEITQVEKLDLDMTKKIFYMGKQAKAAMAQIFRPPGLAPVANRQNKNFTRIPASEFRADDERISRPLPPLSETVYPPSTASESTPRQIPVMTVLSTSSQMVPPRPATAPIPSIPSSIHSTPKTAMKQRLGHPQSTASQPVNSGRKSTTSSAWRVLPTSPRGEVTTRKPRRPSSAASVHIQASNTLPYHTKASGPAVDPVRTPHRKAFDAVNEDDEHSNHADSMSMYSESHSESLNSQASSVRQHGHTGTSSTTPPHTDYILPVSTPRSRPAGASRDSVADRGLENTNPLVPTSGDERSYNRARPEVPSYDQTRARVSQVRNIPGPSNAPEAAPRPLSVHQSALNKDKLDAKATLQSLRQARLDPSDCLLHNPELVICNKENKNICFIHRTGADTTIVRVLAIHTETDPTIARVHAIDGPYFDILWCLNSRLLRDLLRDSVLDNFPLVEEQYQSGLLARDHGEIFQLLDGTGVLNGQYFVQQNYISPESYYYNVWMMVTRDRLKEYVAGFELMQKPDNV